MKKDKPKTLSAAGKRVEKKKQKERGREVGKQHKQTEQFQSENRKLELEFSQIAVNLALKNTAKLSTNPLLVKKLSAINDVRMELDLPTKTMAEQMQVIKDAKKEAKQILKSQKQKAAAPAYDDFKLDPQFDWQDLSHIKIPDGIAPETEGQIFKSLKQLRVIKQIPKREKALPPGTSTPQPPLSLPQGLSPVPPSMMIPSGSLISMAPPRPNFRPLNMVPPLPSFTAVPPVFAEPSAPAPPVFLPPSAAALGPNSIIIPPPPPRFSPGPPPPPRFNLDATIIPGPPTRLAKHFPKTSQAPKDGLASDPLNPEKDLDLTRKQEQSKSVITISAQPKLRDLQKEVAHMVPASLLRNQLKK